MPERDTEYVRWYPLRWEPLAPPSLKPRWRPHWSRNQQQEIAVYLHFPFCASPCEFCPFLKERYSAEGAKAWTDAILEHLQLLVDGGFLSERRVKCVYWGGGTPSLAPIEDVARVMDAICHSSDCGSLAEVSMEALPRRGISDHFVSLQERAGITRCSMGVQTLDGPLLRHWGGHADVECLHKELPKLAERMTVSVDLMYGGPGQSLEAFHRDLDGMVQLDPHQISVYEMILTPTESLSRYGHAPVNEATLRCMSETSQDVLPAAGFAQVLVSDFAKPGRHSLYQVEHWASPQMEVLGLGPGAISYFAGYQFANLASLDAYAASTSSARLPVLAGAVVTAGEELCRNFVLGAKSMSLATGWLEGTYGPTTAHIHEGIRFCEEHGWLSHENGRWRVTRPGLWYVDNVSKAFYSEAMRGERTPIEPDLIEWTTQWMGTRLLDNSAAGDAV